MEKFEKLHGHLEMVLLLAKIKKKNFFYETFFFMHLKTTLKCLTMHHFECKRKTISGGLAPPPPFIM